MCKASKHFIFCSCSTPPESNIADETVYYSWSLSRYLGAKPSMRRGKILKPNHDLGSGIHIDHILNQLNSGIVSFDFEYYPQERDSIDIRIPHPTELIQYFTIIYFNKQWKPGRNNSFTCKTETIKRGKIKQRSTDGNHQFKDTLVILEQESISTLYDRLLKLKLTRSQQREYLSEIVEREPETAYTKSHELLNSFYDSYRLIGAMGLVKLYYSKHKKATLFSQFLDILYTETDDEIVSLLLSTLQEENEKLTNQDIDFICKLNRSKNEVKRSLMEVFSELEHEKVVQLFVEFCEDEDLEIQKEAVFNLVVNNKPNTSTIRDVLLKHCKHTNLELRYDAITALASRKDERVVTIITEELQQLNDHFLSLFEAIEELNDPCFIPILESIKTNYQETNPKIYQGILGTIKILMEG
ncbi:MAG: hypothetical protein ACPGSD_11595 [Flavobacteriales bacterium]